MRNQKNAIVIGLAVVGGAATIALAAVLLSGGSAPMPTEPTAQLGSGQIPVEPLPEARLGRVSMASFSPMTAEIALSNGVASTSLVATDAEVTISGINLVPAVPEITLSTDAGTCRQGMKLSAGESCAIAVTWTPMQAGVISTQLSVRTNGLPGSLTQEIRGMATKKDDGIPLPSLASAPPPPIYPDRNVALLSNRGGFTRVAREDKATDYQPASGWSSIGVEREPSSPPVDMSKVVPIDRTIPAVLETSVDTRKPGRIVAVVERNIFGSDGKTIVIPTGSRAVGIYTAVESAGDERVVIVWTRLTRPDGMAWSLEGYGGDAQGKSGLIGAIDDRLVEKYAAPLLISALDAAATLAIGGDSTRVISPFGSIIESDNARTRAMRQFSDDTRGIVQQVIRDKFKIQPIITIPAGTRITIVPQRDLWLREPGEPERRRTASTDNPAAPRLAPPEPPAIATPVILPPPQVPTMATPPAPEISNPITNPANPRTGQPRPAAPRARATDPGQARIYFGE
jgi:hypothetical protein